ncbi:hypothetical protein [Microbacterium sp. 77mftsu3.1]|uniref:hypothetical protein n=1 Tax=Microbacterium sp. 77mftsu3.1 TaxID=1761802 RepID=UPI0003823324|nr:hypothetical protein [Microbacterium sp. 77mftsu3.1]SDH35407.1 hypothetical protein SAMN04488590_3111 [Microbacterium sp. 77mftsu3.1]
MNMNAVTARENAREKSGEFGSQHHSAPEAALAAPADDRATALTELRRILDGHPELIDHAEGVLNARPATWWRPTLLHVEYDDQLMPEQLDAYLRGDDDESLHAIDDNFRDGEAYWENVNEYLAEILGEDPEDLDIDDDTRQELTSWVGELDESETVPDLVRHNGDVLVQIPATEDDTFGSALQTASEVEGEDERYAAIEKVFTDTLTAAGIEMTEANQKAVREIIDNNSLDFGPQSSEQWRLRLVSYTAPADIALSGYGPHGDAEREVAIEDPYLLLVDPWNGRSYDAKLAGAYKTSINTDRPARLDSELGYGSLDKIAGVHMPAYRSDVTVTV